MTSLQAARHGLERRKHAPGLVKVAFEIDRHGHLLAEITARGSGSEALDAAALTLVHHDAPYHVPPLDAEPSQLCFIAPISFKP